MKRLVGILSGVLAFLTAVFGVCLLLIAIGWPISTERMQELIASVRQMPAVLILVLAAFVLIAVAVVIMYGLIGAHFNRKTSAVLEKNELGETAVSFATLSQIAERTAKKRSDVLSCKTKVCAVGNSVRIEVRAVTSPTASLLELTHALQNEIAQAVSEQCGKAIGTVDVTVDQAEPSSGRA